MSRLRILCYASIWCRATSPVVFLSSPPNKRNDYTPIQLGKAELQLPSLLVTPAGNKHTNYQDNREESWTAGFILAACFCSEAVWYHLSCTNAVILHAAKGTRSLTGSAWTKWGGGGEEHLILEPKLFQWYHLQHCSTNSCISTTEGEDGERKRENPQGWMQEEITSALKEVWSITHLQERMTADRDSKPTTHTSYLHVFCEFKVSSPNLAQHPASVVVVRWQMA